MVSLNSLLLLSLFAHPAHVPDEGALYLEFFKEDQSFVFVV